MTAPHIVDPAALLGEALAEGTTRLCRPGMLPFARRSRWICTASATSLGAHVAGDRPAGEPS
jgi:hypothetical protein